MDKHINFEDNIFILNVRLRMIQDLLILDADPGLFLEKTLDDLVFIDASLVSLFSKLKGNERLLERDEQFSNLSESERVFCEILFEISHGKTAFTALLDQNMKVAISDMMNHSRERRRIIDGLLVESNSSNLEPVVGYDELHELLNG